MSNVKVLCRREIRDAMIARPSVNNGKDAVLACPLNGALGQIFRHIVAS